MRCGNKRLQLLVKALELEDFDSDNVSKLAGQLVLLDVYTWLCCYCRDCEPERPRLTLQTCLQNTSNYTAAVKTVCRGTVQHCWRGDELDCRHARSN